ALPISPPVPGRPAPLDCGPHSAVHGRIAPVPGRRHAPVPAHMTAVATILRSGRRPPEEELHRLAFARAAADGADPGLELAPVRRAAAADDPDAGVPAAARRRRRRARPRLGSCRPAGGRRRRPFRPRPPPPPPAAAGTGTRTRSPPATNGPPPWPTGPPPRRPCTGRRYGPTWRCWPGTRPA